MVDDLREELNTHVYCLLIYDFSEGKSASVFRILKLIWMNGCR